MRLIGLAIILAVSFILAPLAAEAQQAKVYRVGVIFQGGEWDAVLDGLRDGLREQGLKEEQHLVLELRDTKGDLKAVDEAARNLQRDKVDLLYAVAASVTIAARRATTDIPIVFVAGAALPSDSRTVSRNPAGGSRVSISNRQRDRARVERLSAHRRLLVRRNLRTWLTPQHAAENLMLTDLRDSWG